MSRGTTVSVKHKREMLRHSLMGFLCACGALQGCSASGRPLPQLFQSVGEVPTANADTAHAAHEGAQFITETPETRQVRQATSLRCLVPVRRRLGRYALRIASQCVQCLHARNARLFVCRELFSVPARLDTSCQLACVAGSTTSPAAPCTTSGQV